MRRRTLLKTAAALSGPVLWTPELRAQADTAVA